MPTAKKVATVEVLRERISSAPHLILTDPSGLTVEEITKLRNELRKDGTSYSVVKNRLFAIAAGSDLAAKFEPFLAGATGVVFTGSDPVAPAKALKAFGDTKPVPVKGALIDGVLATPAQVEALANMPPKAELQAQLVGMLASPLRGIVGVLAANRGGLVRVLDAYAQQQSSSTPSA